MLQAERAVVVAERDIAVAQAANAHAMLSDSKALIASWNRRSKSLSTNCTARDPSARRDKSIRWKCSSKNW